MLRFSRFCPARSGENNKEGNWKNFLTDVNEAGVGDNFFFEKSNLQVHFLKTVLLFLNLTCHICQQWTTCLFVGDDMMMTEQNPEEEAASGDKRCLEFL